MITKDIAESIVRETMHRLHRNINMMDIDGRIIASGDSTRLGERHEGALEAIRTGKPVVVHETDRPHWKGSQCGINVPILFLGQTVGAVGITGRPEEVAEFGEIVKMTIELMLNQTLLASQQEWRNRAKEAVMEELLKDSPDFAAADDRLRRLNFRLTPSYYALILETDQELAYKEQLVKKLEDAAGPGQALAVIGRGLHIYVLMHGLTEDKAARLRVRMAEMLEHARVPYRMGYSLPAQDLSDIPAAFREAGYALLFGGREVGMTAYAGLEPRAIVFQSESLCKRRFAERLLGGLPEQLVETLQAYLDCGMSIHEAAQSLYVHRNTMIYRLKRIKELTGSDPQVFRDAASLQMALWIASEREAAPSAEAGHRPDSAG
ncbi:CdaR family transcriptional regulator [Paenibacillus piri]|uniref:Sugar diacid utilization regulator n=1 Tax=Paenibacillus piri TaxID=2547395 RepID=A0A4R5KHH1_9BACL|nr:sugar diacid recognition domain-containing protein [Paenibacillus piri]TDF94502.1 hypothetical protein E1757_24165 [Paenibacillus piri]